MMGWARGSELASGVFNAFLRNSDGALLSDDRVGEFALELCELFEGADCDTMDECKFVHDHLEWDEAAEKWVILS